MTRTKILATTVVTLLVILAIVGYNYTKDATAQCGFHSAPLTHASIAEIGNAAINFSCVQFQSSGNSQVRLVRPLEVSDLSELGLDPEMICTNHQLMLAIVQGDFARRVGTRNSAPINYRYALYIIDLDSGTPIFGSTSRNSGGFRKLLNDPTLPDDPIIVPPELQTPDKDLKPVPTDASLVQGPQCNNTSVAPTAAPPK